MPPLPDILLFALVPLVCVAVAMHFATARGTSSQAPSSLVAGGSVAAMLVAWLAVFLPGEAYYLGLKGIVPLVLMWLLFPLLAWNILPGIVGPTLGSPLAYLERRFGERVAIAASVLYVAGRIAISALVLAALSGMMSLALGNLVPPMLVALAIGLLATSCGAACGQRGGTWLAAILLLAAALTVPFAIAAVVQATGGAERMWEIGQASQRPWIGDPTLDLREPGIVWTLAPFALAALLVLLLADEASAARLAQLRSAASVRRALATILLAATALTAAGMYTGLGLFAFYRQHPQEVRPKWAANIEPTTRLSLTDPKTQSPIRDRIGGPQESLLGEGIKLDPATGDAYLPWHEAEISPATINELVRERRIYNPNSRRPIGSVDELLDTDGRIDPTKLASFSLAQQGRPSEMLLHRRATAELWPYFLATQTPPGIRGLLLGGLLAAALAAIDMTAVIGAPALGGFFPVRTRQAHGVLAALATLATTLLAMLATFAIAAPGEMLLFLLAGTLTPIAALVLLGLTSRRAGAGVALAALLFGAMLAVALALLTSSPRTPLHPVWSVTLTLAGTWLMGQLLSAIFGQSRRRSDLRGLVLGPVPIGSLRQEEAEIEIEVVEGLR